MRWRRTGARIATLALLSMVVLAGSAGIASAVSSRPDAGGVSVDPRTAPAAALSKACGPGQAWIVGAQGGVTCLDARRWTTFNGGYGSFPGGSVADVAICRDGTAWFAATSQLLSQKGKTWRAHPATQYRSYDALACDARKGVWAAAYEGVYYYDGTKLKTYPASKLGTGSFVKLVKDIAVGPDGHVWVVTSNSVATFDGSRWTYFEKGKGFDEQYYFDAIAVDRTGRVWAGAGTAGLLSYDGSSWTTLDEDFLAMPQALVADAQGRLWVGTYSHGVSVYDGTTWTTYDHASSPLPDNGVRSLATDASGRAWIGTEWGLAILDGSDWTVYNMHDSGLASDEIRALAVAAKGPALPTPVDKKPGALKGRLVRGGKAQADIPVEICVGYLGMFYSGSTPCASQPFHLESRTDSTGRFAFASVPVGWYSITWLPSGGKWTTLSSAFGLGSSQRLVSSGKTTDVGTIDLAKGD